MEPEVLFEQWDSAIQEEFHNPIKNPSLYDSSAPKYMHDPMVPTLTRGNKIFGFCRRVREYDMNNPIDYVWIDSLCIDKHVSLLALYG